MEDNTVVASRHCGGGNRLFRATVVSGGSDTSNASELPGHFCRVSGGSVPARDFRYTAFTGRGIITHQRDRKFVSERNSLTGAAVVVPSPSRCSNYPPFEGLEYDIQFFPLASGIFPHEFDKV